jgi:hypothetical protein
MVESPSLSFLLMEKTLAGQDIKYGYWMIILPVTIYRFSR